MKVTIGIPTKDRYFCLDKLLLSIAIQSRTDLIKEIIIMDDSENPLDIRKISSYAYILKLFYEKNIDWKYLFGKKIGQHHSHEFIQNNCIGDFVMRCDDDTALDPDVIERLYNIISNDSSVGAVAPLVLMPQSLSLGDPIQYLPDNAENNIANIYAQNIQWYRWKENGIKDVDHLYSCYMYRKGIAKYDLSLSPVASREETIHSHSIKRAGYKLLVDSNSVIYHFKEPSGGIRSHNNPHFYEYDERIFNGYLNLWNVKGIDKKICVLDSGIGDHYSFKNILNKLRENHKNITVAVCFPEVFFDEQNLELISISDAKNIFGDISQFDIYKRMTDWGWRGTLTEAFEKLYLEEKK